MDQIQGYVDAAPQHFAQIVLVWPESEIQVDGKGLVHFSSKNTYRLKFSSPMTRAIRRSTCRYSSTRWRKTRRSRCSTELEQTKGITVYDGLNECPVVDLNRCKKHGEGKWVEIPGDPEVTFMHSVLLPNSDKILHWGGGYTNVNQTRLYDCNTQTYDSPANQPASLPGERYGVMIFSNENIQDSIAVEYAELYNGRTKDRAQVPVTIDETVRVAEADEPINRNSLPFDLAPNPSRESLRLYWQGAERERVRLVISDLSGKIHYQDSKVLRQGWAQELNLAILPNGVYIISISIGNNRWSSRFVKAH